VYPTFCSFSALHVDEMTEDLSADFGLIDKQPFSLHLADTREKM
jgi:hypothetical protein